METILQIHPVWLAMLGFTGIVLAVGLADLVSTATRGWFHAAPDLAEGREPAETCIDCGGVLHEHNQAITCPEHLLCLDCDAAHNPCRECRTARAEHGEVWEVGPDPLLNWPTHVEWDPPAVRTFLEAVRSQPRNGGAA